MTDSLILVGIITGGTIKVDTVSCLFNTMIDVLDPKGDEHIKIGLLIPVGGYSSQNRTIIAEEAVKHNCSHVMFIDNDMQFPPNGIKELFRQNKDIIGANYYQRRMPLVSTVKILGKNGKFKNGSVKEFDTKTFKVGAVGTGFMLVKTSVFNNISRPWFFAGEDERGEFITEDVYFCNKAREAGFDVWCDPTIILNHIGDYRY